MSDLIRVPEWFDKFYKYVQRDCGNANLVKMKFIQALVKQGWGSTFIEEIIEDNELLLTHSTTEYIKKIDEQVDIGLYILNYSDDLIKALIDEYEVEEEKYIVVAKETYGVTEGKPAFSDNYGYQDYLIFSKIPHRKIYYVDDKYQEDCIDVPEDVLSSEIITEKFSSELLSLFNRKPELIMNKEEAEKLINSYRMMIPIKS